MNNDIWARRARALQFGLRLLAVATAMSVPCSVHAQAAAPRLKETSVTLYGGYRSGGSLTDENTESSVRVRNDASYAFAVDIGLDRQTQVQLFYSHQQSALSSESLAPTLNNEGLSIDYYHVGGTYFFEEVGAGGYVIGGFGATHVRPDRGDLNSETFLSGHIGAGFMLPLGKHLGLRFEARGYGTLINNDSAMFCSDSAGCVVSIKGDAMYQGEALAGLSIRF